MNAYLYEQYQFGSYLSEKSKMLNDEMGTLCFSCSTFPTDDYALREKKLHIACLSANSTSITSN